MLLGCSDLPPRPLPLDDVAITATDGLGCKSAELEVDEGALHPTKACEVCGPEGAFISCPYGCANGDCLGVSELALGWEHSCARLSDGTVMCWGGRAFGQLGTRQASVDPTPIPEAVTGLPPVRALCSGKDHLCAIDEGDGLWCWGRNHLAQAVPEASADVVAPVRVLEDVQECALGGHSSCAVIGPRRGVVCWGASLNGQDWASDAFAEVEAGPTMVDGLTDVQHLVVGLRSACAVHGDGLVSCWGSGENGELGAGDLADRARPAGVALPEALGPITITAGHRLRFALSAEGRLFGWGDNRAGAIGLDAGEFAVLEAPVELNLLAWPIARVAAGEAHSCAIASGVAFCWGTSRLGNLGYPGDGIHVPRKILGVHVASLIAVGNLHSCARERAGWIECWGDNGQGQTGAPLHTESVVLTPAFVQR